jgi:hypothetical protein
MPQRSTESSDRTKKLNRKVLTLGREGPQKKRKLSSCSSFYCVKARSGTHNHLESKIGLFVNKQESRCEVPWISTSARRSYTCASISRPETSKNSAGFSELENMPISRDRQAKYMAVFSVIFSHIHHGRSFVWLLVPKKLVDCVWKGEVGWQKRARSRYYSRS